MPINVTCKCGKRFQAKDDLAGKKVRCPGCKAVIPVPRPAPPKAAVRKPAAPKPAAPTRLMPKTAAPKPPAPKAATPKPAPPKPAAATRLMPKAAAPPKPAAKTMLAPAGLPVRFYCVCGRQLLADPSNAGRKMRCSACAAVVPIPALSEEAPFLAPAATAERPAPTVNVWADRSLEQQLTPWRDERAERQGGGRYPEPRSLAWLAALLVLLAAAGVGAAGYLYWPDITGYVNRRATEDAKAAPVSSPALDRFRPAGGSAPAPRL